MTNEGFNTAAYTRKSKKQLQIDAFPELEQHFEKRLKEREEGTEYPGTQAEACKARVEEVGHANVGPQSTAETCTSLGK